MEIHQLRYFCAVAETSSFSRAAVQSHVSQPSLSQQILKLEDELGARLFDRLGRSVRLTELGKTFLPRARAVLRELEAAKGDVDERKDSVGGSICIGVIPTIAPYLLPPHLTFFTRQFPQARLAVVEEITPVSIPKLFSRAASSAASSAWWALVWASPSSPRWPSTSARPAVTFALRIVRPRAPSALSSSSAVLSLVSNSPFFGACAARLPEFSWRFECTSANWHEPPSSATCASTTSLNPTA